MKILFVCLGNICRSPMAEAMFTAMVAQAGLANQVVVDSAATSNEEVGNPAHPGTKKILAQHGLSSQGLVSRQITTADFYESDYIICMDENNRRDLQRIAPADATAQIYQIFDIVPGQKGHEVADPWYTGNFSVTYQDLDQALPYWLDLITKQLA